MNLVAVTETQSKSLDSLKAVWILVGLIDPNLPQRWANWIVSFPPLSVSSAHWRRVLQFFPENIYLAGPVFWVLSYGSVKLDGLNLLIYVLSVVQRHQGFLFCFSPKKNLQFSVGVKVRYFLAAQIGKILWEHPADASTGFKRLEVLLLLVQSFWEI